MVELEKIISENHKLERNIRTLRNTLNRILKKLIAKENISS